MPVMLSFEIEGAGDQQRQIGALFERLGWERLESSTYRYPRLAEKQAAARLEDWFNHVVPALMLFRCYVLRHRLTVKQFTLDAASWTGYRRGAEIGSPPLVAENIRLRQPTGETEVDVEPWSALEDWLDAIDFPLGLSS